MNEDPRVLRVLPNEEIQIAVLDFLKREAQRSNYWFSINEIRLGCGHAHITVRRAIYDLAVGGFLQLRDGDVDNEDLRIALAKHLRTDKNPKRV